MPISFDSALGIHQQALSLRTQRTEILASNIANADTPGYKARDIDFKSALQASQVSIDKRHQLQHSDSLSTTNSRHIKLDRSETNVETLYRVPNQSALDGNTVDGQLEKSAFAENALRYQASLEFLGRKFKGMLSALKGE
jgi:flagellar basal-body rod protein FlgB